MTDSQKLDLLIEQMQIMNEQIGDLENQVKEVKRQQMRSTAELKAMDGLILDEVERVHDILSRHTSDKSKHIA